MLEFTRTLELQTFSISETDLVWCRKYASRKTGSCCHLLQRNLLCCWGRKRKTERVMQSKSGVARIDFFILEFHEVFSNAKKPFVRLLIEQRYICGLQILELEIYWLLLLASYDHCERWLHYLLIRWQFKILLCVSMNNEVMPLNKCHYV